MPGVIDALRDGDDAPRGIDGRVGTMAVEKAERIIRVAIDLVPSGNLSGGVDASRVGKNAPWGIDRGVGAVAVDEAEILAATVFVIPGDLFMLCAKVSMLPGGSMVV